MLLRIFTIFLLLVITSCSGNPHEDSKKANNIIYRLIEADNKSDINTVLSSYTDDIEFYPAGRPFIKGIDSVRSSYVKLFEENQLSISTQILETVVTGNIAIVTGINTGTRKSLMDSSINKIDDKYIALLKKNQDGDWKIDKLIWGLHH
jgi:ketosteroid isomerase-like protein